jgi:hypothetical protein
MATATPSGNRTASNGNRHAFGQLHRQQWQPPRLRATAPPAMATATPSGNRTASNGNRHAFGQLHRQQWQPPRLRATAPPAMATATQPTGARAASSRAQPTGSCSSSGLLVRHFGTDRYEVTHAGWVRWQRTNRALARFVADSRSESTK